jgi:transposase
VDSGDCAKRQTAAIEAQIAEHLSKHQANLAALLQSIRGNGPATTAALISELPELGQFNAMQICALVGVARMNRDSGQSRGKRIITSGRATVRSALYMAAVVEIRHNAAIRVCYQRLAVAGMSKKVALVDCMRKLLITMNAMVKSGLP